MLKEILNQCMIQLRFSTQYLAAQNVATDKTMWTIGKGKHLYWLDKSRQKFQHGSDPITKMWSKPTTAIVAKSV